MQSAFLARSRAFPSTGRSIPARMAMIATTMRSSIRVKILAFILDAGTEDSDSKKERGNIGIEERRSKAEWD